MQFFGRNFTFALIEHLDVAAEWNGGNSIFGALFVVPTPKHIAKSDRKPQHLDATAPGYIEVTEFVNSNQDDNRHQKP